MKKQKFMKLTAFASAPSIENSFSSPETHNAEISVVFSGKSVKIHGWDGSTWSMIYTWANMDKQFTFNNTYQSYFLESLTGQDELMSVSFFSIDSYQGSTPTLAGVDREVRLYDVDEVPIYTASDNGKMLTVMSDGTLQWLGENETWMIDGSPAPTSSASTSWLEEDSGLSLGTNHALVNGILEVNMVGSNNWNWDNVSYHDWSLVASEPTYVGTYSIWFKSTGDSYKAATVNNALFIINGFQNATQGFSLKVKNGTQVQIGGAISYPYVYKQVIGNLSETVLNGNWHHVVVSVSLDELDQTVVQAVVDGVAGTTWTVSKRNIGASGTNVRSIFGASPAVGPQVSNGHFDAAEFVAGTALTEAQMISLYNAGQGGMSIGEASAL